jgi:F-type H+-transporting ATPase subunit delta
MTDLSKIARPYAKAAFEFAQQHGTLNQWSKTLKTLSHYISQPEVIAFLKNPRYSDAEHLQLCIDLGDSLLDEASKNFIRTLAKNNRLSSLPYIAEQFETYRAAAEKVQHVLVKSAIPLDEKIREKLKQQLADKYASHIELENEVDPKLLGGLVVYIGDQVIDSSLQGQLARLRDAVKG